MAGKAVLTPRQPQGADAAPGGAAQNADLPVSQLRQVVDGLGGGGPVVYAQRGQQGVVQPRAEAVSSTAGTVTRRAPARKRARSPPRKKMPRGFCS